MPAGIADKVASTPSTWRKAASTPQKHPAAKVARSAPSGPRPSNGGAGAGPADASRFLSFSKVITPLTFRSTRGQ